MATDPFADLIPTGVPEKAQNPFADLIPTSSAPTQATPQAPSGTIAEKAIANIGGGFDSVIGQAVKFAGGLAAGAASRAADIASGGWQMLGQAATGAGLTGTGRFLEGVSQVAKEDSNRIEGYAPSGAAGTIGRVVGNIAPEIAAGAVMPGATIGKAILTGAEIGAASGLTGRKEDGQSRVTGAATGALLGAAGGAVGTGLVKAAQATPGVIRGIFGNTDEVATRVAQQIPEDQIATVMNRQGVADKLGTAITPGEATGLKSLQAGEGRLPVTAAAQQKVEQILGARENILKDKLTTTVANIVKEGDEVAKASEQGLYKKAYQAVVPKEEISALRSNPAIAAAEKTAAADPYSMIQQVKPGSLGYWDAVKRALDNKIGADQVSGQKNPAVAEALNSLKGTLDNISPEYKAAREIGQKVILKRNIQSLVDDIPLQAGQEAPSLNQLYQAVAGTPKKQKEFYRAVESGGTKEEVAGAKELLDFINIVRQSPIQKLIRKSSDMESVKFGGDIQTRLLDKAADVLKGKYNQALLDVTLDPKKYKIIEKAHTAIKKSPKDAGRVVNIVGQVVDALVSGKK